ncbi:MAG TPA: hypothetical protein PKA27_10540 [Fimbriimonadaceae bacterium]|mgnify:CR=1 FL=1|nr:hypothetical protein [Fimbriimonadaceae bacterium]
MKRLLLSVFVACSGTIHAQNIKVPPPITGPHPLPKAQWMPGTPDGLSPVFPVIRSTRKAYPPIQPQVGEQIDYRWDGPVYTPPPFSETAPVIQDDAVETDAPDLMHKAIGFLDDGTDPANTHMAASSQYIVHAVNNRWGIYDKAGRMVFETSIATFLGDATSIIESPRVIFDPWNARWVQLWHSRRLGGQPVGFLVVMVSDDADPNGSWFVYSFGAVTGELTDLAYPNEYDLGYGSVGVYASGNQYRFVGGAYSLATIRTWNKAQLYSGFGALMRTDLLFTNPDGSPVFHPRAAHMQATFGGLDAVFVNSRPGGGNKVTLWKLADPFGAHNLTPIDITTSAYDVPPVAVQPDGTQLGTQDCRLVNAVVSTFDGTPMLATGTQESHQWTDDTEPRAVNHFFVLNPSANVAIFEGIFGLPRYYYWISAASLDFLGTAMWTIARCGVNSPAYPELRYVDWNAGVFSNASKQVQSGGNNQVGSIWGKYTQATIDWSDYVNATSKIRHWFTGPVIGNNLGEWRSWMATTAFNATPGAFTVTPANGLFSTGNIGGPFTPNSITYSLTNTGQVGAPFEVVDLPAWLNADISTAEVRGGSSQAVRLSLDPLTTSYEIGMYTGTITFRNLFTGAVETREVSLRVLGRIFPTSVIVFQGSGFQGTEEDMAASDNRYFSAFNDEVNMECAVVALSVSPVTSPVEFTLGVEANAQRRGLAQSVSLFNYQTSQFVQIDGTAASTADQVRTSRVTTQPSRFINQLTRQVAVQIKWQPINDEDPSQDGWLHNVDQVYWSIEP